MTALGRPAIYLNCSGTDKEQTARGIMQAHEISAGPIGVLSSVEPCWSFEIHRNRMTKQEDKRRSARVTRIIRMLRAHGILAKVPRTHRYLLTPLGRQLTTAIQTAKSIPISRLLPLAA